MRAQTDVSIDAEPQFEIRSLALPDLREAMRRGMDDFFARPTHGIFITIMYLLVAFLAAMVGLGRNPLPMLFPLVSGFALIGPLAACGLYELSRRREAGLDYSWWHIFDVFHAPSRWGIFVMGVLLALLFTIWMFTASFLYGAYFGDEQHSSLAGMLTQIVSTAAGWQMMMSGVFIGFVYSVLVFVSTIVALPLMIHHKVSLSQAVGLSVAATLRNWKAMVVWYVLVIAMVVLGALPLLLGLAIVVPVLGHATWHLYRKSVRLHT